MANDNKPIWKDYPLYCGNGDYVIEELVNGTWQTRKRFHVLRTPYGGGEVAANDMLCADLKTGYPETTGVTTHSAAYRRYRCQTGSTASQTQVFNFCQDWSYDEWDGEARALSAPINGHADMRQRLFRSRFGETEEEIEIREMVRPQFSFDYSSDVSASNTAGYLTVTANEDYTIYCGSSWIQNLNTGGTEGEQTFYFYIEPYTGFTDRSTVIEITYLGYEGNYETVELPLVQRAIVPFFNVYPVEQSVSSESSTTVFVANTNVPFTVSDNQSWLELQGITQAGYQAYNVAFNYSANTGDLRQAVITFTYPVSATQSGTTTAVLRQEGAISNNIIYYTSSNGARTGPRYTGSTYFGASIVSNTYYPNDDYGEIVFDGPVTLIGKNTFNRITRLRSIIIPDKVTLIAGSAFEVCDNLESVIIGSSVETIGYSAFYYCTKLSALTIGASVKTIGQNAFGSATSLKTLIIPDSVTTIMYSAFYGCSSLSSVTIGSNVSVIGERAFHYCSRLPSITLPGSVISIGQQAFDSCVRLSSINIPDSVTTIGDSAFENCLALSSITIGSGVTTIGSKAFSGCTALSSVTIGSGTIGSYAFRDCPSLSSVTIGSNVSVIGERAFGYCSSLSSITIPDSVISVGTDAFYTCTGLTSVIIGSGVTAINDHVFYKCTSLSSVTIGPGVTTIGNNSFGYCYSLNSITIPDSVTSIGRSFEGCTGLTTVTIGSGVTIIYSFAFQNCYNLSTINYTGTKAQWGAITKQNRWNDGVPATVVHCTDGDTPI